MFSRKIYGVGETVYDILFRNGNPLKAVPGGSAFNALITLGRCGLSPVLSTFVGDDPIGRLTLDFMQRNGVDTGYVEIRKNSKSHLSLAFLNEVNDAEYVFYKDHASLSVELTLPAFLPGDYLLFGSFFAINPVIRPQMLRYLSAAVHAGATLYYDINFRPSHLKDLPAVKEHVLENIRLSSVVRGSMEDFHCLFGVDNDCPDRYALAADIYHRHLKGECPYLLVTDGARAVHVLTPVRHLVFEVAPISTVSTVEQATISMPESCTSCPGRALQKQTWWNFLKRCGLKWYILPSGFLHVYASRWTIMSMRNLSSRYGAAMPRCDATVFVA